MSRPAFPHPAHDHARCAHEAVRTAERICAERSERLTPMRLAVLQALAESHQPLGAYQIMDRLAEQGPRPAPISVYRALNFLLEQGFAHRIESRNAFVACVHDHARSDLVVFMICERCGNVGEASSPAMVKALAAAAESAGFAPKAPVIEIPGLCAHCR